jgi:hypothetical protein
VTNTSGPDVRTRALAATHALKFILTWNCKHLANEVLRPKMAHICRKAGYACPRIVTPDEILRLHTHAPELPADLTGLIPNREAFIRYVRLSRGVKASHEPDLAAYNEDGRRRAVVLEFPPESFVVSKDDFPVDWQAMMREAEAELAQLPPGVEELPQHVKDALYAGALAKRDLANRS